MSHNLDLVFDVADRIVVMRLGRCVGVREAATTDRSEIVHLIMGGSPSTPATGRPG